MTIDGLDEIAMTFKLKFNLQVRALVVKRWTNELEDVGSNPTEGISFWKVRWWKLGSWKETTEDRALGIALKWPKAQRTQLCLSWVRLGLKFSTKQNFHQSTLHELIFLEKLQQPNFDSGILEIQIWGLLNFQCGWRDSSLGCQTQCLTPKLRYSVVLK